MKTRKSILDGWLLPIVLALFIAAGWSLYDATTLELSKDPKHAKGLRAFNTFMTAATRVANKTGDKWAKELVRAADYYTSVHVAKENFQTIIRQRWIGSNLILVGYFQKGDEVDEGLRDTAMISSGLGMIGKSGAIFIHERAAESKPNYIRGLMFLHAMNDTLLKGGTAATLLEGKVTIADEIRSAQEMLNLAGLIGGKPYTKSVEDAVVYSLAGVEPVLILGSFMNQNARIFEAETLAERHAVNRLFALHIEFRAVELRWVNDPERATIEKGKIVGKIRRLFVDGNGTPI